MQVDEDAIMARVQAVLAVLAVQRGPFTANERRIAIYAIAEGIRSGVEMMMNPDELVK